MPVLNVAGYKFVALTGLPSLRDRLYREGVRQELKGTLLLGEEGINLMLAGEPEKLQQFLDFLLVDDRLKDMTFHKTLSTACPFNRLKVKIRREIITLRLPTANPLKRRVPDVSPRTFSHRLDEKRPVTVLDTRNDFEIRYGAFRGALNPGLKDFSAFPDVIAALPRDVPVVMYCTGGIRCEKAGLALLDAGFREVYQLRGGILGYFAEMGGAHYEGDCFVFDQRVALNAALQPILE